jgi:probable phosphoglycerate mutase
VRGPLDWREIEREDRLPILLVRHGRTAWNVERRFLGRTDVPLDEVGLDQAARLAAHLGPVPFQALISSPLARAKATAEALAQGRALSLETDPDLVELHQGELEGCGGEVLQEQRHADFFQAWKADPSDVRVPGGETLRECQARTLRALERHAARCRPGAPLVVVSHQMAIAATVLALQGRSLQAFRDVQIPHTGVTVLAYDGTFRVDRIGVADHIETRMG